MHKKDTKLLLYSFAFISFIAFLLVDSDSIPRISSPFLATFAMIVFVPVLLISIVVVSVVFRLFTGIIREVRDRIYEKYPLIKKALGKVYNILAYIFNVFFMLIVAIYLLSVIAIAIKLFI